MGKVLFHIIPAIGLGFIMQIVLHEVGHLIGGLLTGWRFLYLHIYKIVIKRESSRLKLMIVGEIGYKCIMYPKSINQGVRLYTMGGCIMNLLSSVTALLVLIMVSVHFAMWLYIWSFVALGIGLFFMNGVASTERVCNDKACYNLMESGRYNNHKRHNRNNKHNMLCHNAQLITARHLIDGLSYSEIGEEIICNCPDIAENDIQAYQAILEYYYYLDIKNYLKMKKALKKIRNRDNISREILDILELELIYVRLLCATSPHIRRKARSNLPNSLGRTLNCISADSISPQLADSGGFTIKTEGNKLNKHKKRGDVHTFRVKAIYDAYIHFVRGNMESSIDILNEAIKLIDNTDFVYPGEKKFCVRQLKEIRKMFSLA